MIQGNQNKYIFRTWWFKEKVKESKICPKTIYEVPYGENMYSSILSSTSALDGVDGQHHAPAALPPATDQVPNFRGACVGPRTGLDECGKSRLPHRDSIPRTFNSLPVTIRTTLLRHALVKIRSFVKQCKILL
jgi:hypothetical protein